MFVLSRVHSFASGLGGVGFLSVLDVRGIANSVGHFVQILLRVATKANDAGCEKGVRNAQKNKNIRTKTARGRARTLIIPF